MFSYKATMYRTILRFYRRDDTFQNSPCFIQRQFGWSQFDMEQKANKYNLKIIFTSDNYFFGPKSNIRDIDKFVCELNSLISFKKMDKNQCSA